MRVPPTCLLCCTPLPSDIPPFARPHFLTSPPPFCNHARGARAAATPQVIYSSTPLWSAIMAHVLLQGESASMGHTAWVGAGVMMMASLVASLADLTR